jgi:hypothetical protein
MAEYKGIKGFKVQYLSADPSNPIIGQTWYNSTSKDLKYTSVTTAGSWATGGSMSTARNALGSAGDSSAALAFGGGTAPGARSSATEEYDGSTWTTGGSLTGTARSDFGGAGTQTAGLASGGYVISPTARTADNEEYDGTSWTSATPLPTGTNGSMETGIQTAAVVFGGFQDAPSPNPGRQVHTFNYDGSTWTSGGNLNTATSVGGGAGTQTAALKVGGNLSTGKNAVSEEYDGTSWTNGGSQPAANDQNSALGTQTNALGLVGTTPPGAFNGAVTIYDGTSWAADSFLNTIRYYGQSSGSTPVGITFGGNTPSLTGATEEYTAAGAVVTKTITVS